MSGYLRAAPEALTEALAPDAAIAASKTAFHAARREQLALMACNLNQLLFDPSLVGYQRLLGLRGAAREQVQNALTVERLLNEAIEAFEATRGGK